MNKASPLFSIGICTFNRPQHFFTLLSQLKNSPYLKKIGDIVVVEDVSSFSSYVHKNLLKQYFPDQKIKCFQVTYTNVGKSRQLILRHAHGPILIFLDDDCELHPDYFKYLSYYEKRFPTVVGFTGPVLPAIFTNLTYYLATYHNQPLFKEKKPRWIETFPFTCIAFRLTLLKKMAASFDPNLPYGEDMDFILQITSRGGKILFHPKLYSWHHFSNNLLHALRKKYLYATFYGDIYQKKYASYSLDPYLPHSKFEAYIWPLTILVLPFKLINYYLYLGLYTPVQFFYMYVNELACILGFSTSPKGRAIIRSKISELQK